MKPNHPTNTCIDCGCKITEGASRCRDCSYSYRYPKHNFCIDCGKELARKRKSYPATRCRKCYLKTIQQPKRFCDSCGKQISRDSKTGLCGDCLCSQKKVQTFCIACGKEISLGAKRCRRCATEYRWSNPDTRAKLIQKQKKGWSKPGVKERFGKIVKERWADEEWASDTISKIRQGWSDNGPPFQSNLEESVQEVLTDLGVDFETQWQIPSYRYIYDIFIPCSNLLVEVNGEFWHYSDYAEEQGFVDRDKEKKQLAEQAGYAIVHLRESLIEEIGPKQAVEERVIPRLV